MGNIIPKLQHMSLLQGAAFLIPDKITYFLGPFPSWCVQVFLERAGICGEETGDEEVMLYLKRDEQMEEEEYRITVNSNRITVTAARERGVIHALTTVYRLIEHNRIPSCEISDKPRYSHRGLSLDCARHFFGAGEVKKIIEQLSMAKMNVLHWHLSDDQGWRIESKVFPKLHEISGKYYTQEQIRDVVSYAKHRGVEIIPEIDMPGHVAAMVAAYPMLCCTQEQIPVASGMGIYSDILCAGKESTYEFLEKLLDEICPLFISDRFHIGGDEAPKTRWKECHCCTALMKKLGLENYDDLQGVFSTKVSILLKKHGKHPVIWNDSLKAKKIPENAIVQFWSLQYNRQAEVFAKKEGKWIYSDMFELYLDYPYSMTPIKKVYEIIPHFGSIPVPDGCGPIGLEAAIWCEHIAEEAELERRLFPRIYALAETAWSGMGDYGEFCQRLEREQSRFQAAGVSCTERAWWDPKGRARRQEAIAYMKRMNGSMSKEKKAETVEATKPSPEFGQAFVKQFFKKSDLLFLLPVMLKK